MRSPFDIISNFHWIVPGEAARSGQASAFVLRRLLRAHGLASIINLRGENADLSWWQHETRIAAASGVAHLDAMLDSRMLPTRAMLTRLIEAFETAPKPLVVKCSGGQDRTSFAAALFLVHRGGWEALDAALAQFARFPYLHFPKRHQRWLKPFLLFARERARGMPLAQWVRGAYEPQDLSEWLKANELGASFAGLFVVRTRSRWQW
jgi:hypothetical protein